jgi:hypothetical protein
MPPTGSIFTDWQQVEKESRLLMNEDFSWSEPPQRRRRRITEEPIRAHRRAAVLDHEPEQPRPEPITGLSGYEHGDYELSGVQIDDPADHVHVDLDAWDQPTAAHSHFDEMMEQWSVEYGDAADRAFDLTDPGTQVASEGGRRTVVITGRGDERYMPAPRRPRSAELRFHERSTFSPDRAALWALLLGIALVIGAIAH